VSANVVDDFPAVHEEMWNSQQIVSERWIDESTKPWIETQCIEDFGFTTHYGFQWWLLPLDGIPGIRPQQNDIYMAWGRYGQFVFAIPYFDMAVVIASDNKESAEFLRGIFLILYDHILPAVETY
jgi:CubicO group peptidase (beta-lactamase class C family)